MSPRTTWRATLTAGVFAAHVWATYKFTDKERDSESGLDYFGARYYSSSMGRFISPDYFANDIDKFNPQSLNRYTYARNNPLVYVDPTGEAVQLNGKTEEDRKKELAAVQESLKNKNSASKLYINEVKDKQGTRYFVGIQGDAKEFAKTGVLESRLAEVVGSSSIVGFTLSGSVSTRVEGIADFLLSPHTFAVGQEYGGGVTLRSDASTTGNIESVVDPNDIRDRLSEAPRPNLGEAVAHELLGHALGFIRSPRSSSSATNPLALEAENEARRRGGADRGQRSTHP
jgi:RHS repeat-associated protein